MLERRIKEIATKEDRKNLVYYKPQTFLHDQAFNWVNHGQVLRVPTASYLRLNAGTLHHTRISDFGDWIDNNVASPDGTAARMNYIRCKAMMNCLQFRHSGIAPLKVYLWIMSVPGSVPLSAQVTIPTIDTFPFTGNQLFKHLPKIRKELLSYKYTIHAKRMVVVSRGKVFLQSIPISNAGSNQGYQWTNSAQNWSESSKTVNFNLFFKGRGKRFLVTDGDARPATKEYFLCMTADGQFDVLGTLSQTIYLDKLSDTAQIAAAPA